MSTKTENGKKQKFIKELKRMNQDIKYDEIIQRLIKIEDKIKDPPGHFWILYLLILIWFAVN